MKFIMSEDCVFVIGILRYEYMFDITVVPWIYCDDWWLCLVRTLPRHEIVVTQGDKIGDDPSAWLNDDGCLNVVTKLRIRQLQRDWSLMA